MATIDLPDNLVLRTPTAEDLQALARAFTDGQLDETDNISPFRRDALTEPMPGVLRLVVVDQASGVLSGGGTMHHHDPERGTIEIGYWLLPSARGRGIATNVARALAGYAFTLGVQRVGARVAVGNVASDRVLERAGFTREDVIRSTGGVEKTFYSLRRAA